MCSTGTLQFLLSMVRGRMQDWAPRGRVALCAAATADAVQSALWEQEHTRILAASSLVQALKGLEYQEARKGGPSPLIQPKENETHWWEECTRLMVRACHAQTQRGAGVGCGEPGSQLASTCLPEVNASKGQLSKALCHCQSSTSPHHQSITWPAGVLGDLAHTAVHELVQLACQWGQPLWEYLHARGHPW